MARYDYKVVYENNRGQSIDLTALPYAINIEPLLDYSWAYATRDRRRGSRIAGFNKAVASKSITLHILGQTIKERNEAIDAFNNIIEVDIYDGIAGKIWFDDWYTYGYIVSSQNEKWQYDKGVIKKTIQLVREEETWYHLIIKNSYSELPEDDDFEQGIKDYELDEETELVGYDYSYDYGVDKVSTVEITNPNPLGCNFIVAISGPVNNPYLRIGDTIINVNVEVVDGANLVIDSGAKTITLTLPDGIQVNAFGARNPDYYIFQLIESGINPIVWDGSFSWQLQMIEERSEPRWLMD